VTPTFLQLGHCGPIKAGVHWLPFKLLDVVGPPDMETNEGVTSAPDWMDNCLRSSLYLRQNTEVIFSEPFDVRQNQL